MSVASKKKPTGTTRRPKAAGTTAERPVQSAAAPSPFTPIADYAFLSDCHTSALTAPDGSIDWLCVPRFDAPSVFGSLLDREAGLFRLAPFGTTVPSARAYVPGTNVLVTTWKTPQGWAGVRDALTIGPRSGEDRITPHTRPPADEDADHMLVRTVTCLDGEVEIELVCEPAFDYGRTPAEWALVDGSRHAADASGAGQTIRLRTDLELGIEADRVRARRYLEPGTSTVRYSTRSSSTRCTVSACPGDCGRSSKRRPLVLPEFGASPIRGFGRRAASPSTTSHRSSCAGSRC